MKPEIKRLAQQIQIVGVPPDNNLLKLLIGEEKIILPRKGVYTRVFRASDQKNITSLVAQAYNFPLEDTGLIADTMSLVMALGDVVRPGVTFDLTYTA